jgi:hypothetical protein
LGQLDEAFPLLTRLAAQAPHIMPRFQVDPVWDPIRADSRFQALMPDPQAQR